MPPLVSVIIPTANRPNYLPRALDSALTGMDPGDIEVIIIPNGPDNSWRTSLLPYKSNRSVKVIPIQEANANVARNTGLLNAKGKFVRFLDDDDYLYPDAACEQYIELERNKADVSTGRIINIDVDNNILGEVTFPKTNDFVCACTQNPFALPTRHVFKREKLLDCKWNPDIPRAQDYIWMIDLAKNSEWEWIKDNNIVGVWFQHPGHRTTITRACNKTHQDIALALFELINALQIKKAFSLQRKEFIVNVLWNCVHNGFPLNPLYWHRIAIKLLQIAPNSTPNIPIYQSRISQIFGTLTLEWLFLPKRVANRFYRELLGRIFGWDYRRIL